MLHGHGPMKLVLKLFLVLNHKFVKSFYGRRTPISKIKYSSISSRTHALLITDGFPITDQVLIASTDVSGLESTSQYISALSALSGLSNLSGLSSGLSGASGLSSIHSYPLMMRASGEVVKNVINDPVIEAAALSDLAHFALDIITFLTPETSIIARSFAVIGHILCIGSDYVLDHNIIAQDLVFHVGMLGISVQLLGKTLSPIVAAASKPILVRDKRTYCSVFRPVGVSWLQFKAAYSIAFEWEEFAPNSTIYTQSAIGQWFSCPECYDDGCFYWLYDGDVEMVLDGLVVEHVGSKRGISANGNVGLLGNLEYMDILKHTRTPVPNRRKTENKKSPTTVMSYQETIRTGAKGATLLRINKSRLLALMENDELFSESIQLLVMKDIHYKLGNAH